jgi:hypothetical protein
LIKEFFGPTEAGGAVGKRAEGFEDADDSFDEFFDALVLDVDAIVEFEDFSFVAFGFDLVVQDGKRLDNLMAKFGAKRDLEGHNVGRAGEEVGVVVCLHDVLFVLIVDGDDVFYFFETHFMAIFVANSEAKVIK